LTLTDTLTAKTRTYKMNLYGLPYDHKYGNGPYVPSKTKCYLNTPYHPLPRFKSKNEVRVGDWAKMYCRLYTADNLMYYDYVDPSKIDLIMKNGTAINNYVVKNWHGKFWIKFMSTVADLEENLTVRVNGENVTSFEYKFWWK
jgi:hypothetical protein